MGYTIAYKLENLFHVDKSNTEGTVEALFNSMRYDDLTMCTCAVLNVYQQFHVLQKFSWDCIILDFACASMINSISAGTSRDFPPPSFHVWFLMVKLP